MRPAFPSLLLLAAAASLPAQTVVSLNGASGAVSHATSRSTNGGLSIGLGFEVEYLVVGGGGGGGNGYDSGPGGGGGAGGLTQGSVALGSSVFGVTVGAGGAGGTSGSGANGGNSSLGNIVMLGGGGGGASRGNGLAGGSGGGAGGRPLGGNRTGGGASSGFGNAGGNNYGAFAGDISYGGGGGGGAASAGQSRTSANASTNAGIWGEGITSSIDGTSRQYAFGGYGGYANFTSTGTNATIIGGGGAGASINVNGASRAGGSGAAGAVIVRYLGAAAGTGGTVSSVAVPGYTVHSFTTAGSSSLDLSGLNLNTRLGASQDAAISGTGDLTFTGPGTLTLNAANTYTGATRVNAGTLALGASGSVSGSSGIHVASGSTFDVSAKSGFTLASGQTLSGGGTVVGDTVIAGSHTPGFSPGLQTFSNNLTYAAGSSITWELAANSTANRGTFFDGIDVQGDLTFQDPVTLALSFNYIDGVVDWTAPFWDAELTGTAGWKIFGVTGTVNGFANLQIANAEWLDANGTAFATARPQGAFTLHHEVGDGIYLNYTPVPEPSTYGLILGALALAGTAVRRRKTSK